jgi:hypothetical protein
MTNAPGSESPGSSSDSPEPEDGQSPASTPSESADFPAGADVPPRWSPRQPPPISGWVRWNPPPGAPPPQVGEPRWGGGWGTPHQAIGSWHPGPWSQPQGPKPGVIPLRPLSVGDLLNGAFATLRLHWRAVLAATFVIALVTEGAMVVVQGLFLNDTRINDLKNNTNPSFYDILRAVSGTFAALGLTSLVTMVGTVFATGLLALVTSRAVLGHSVKARDLWRDARPRLPHLLGLTLLIVVILCGVVLVSALPGFLFVLAGAPSGGAALGSLGLLGGAITSVWLWVQWSLAAPALTLEKQGVVAAMKRSTKLVHGTWWRVLGIPLLAVLIATLISTIIEIPFALIGSAVGGDGFTSVFSSNGNPGWTYLIIAGAGQVLASTITLPISAGVTALLYMDQRIRRESLDIALVRAAAVQTSANSGA